jgi:hypothetical protein
LEGEIQGSNRLAVLALFTGALAVVAVLQWLTLEKTDETFWAGQRPWINLSHWQPEDIEAEHGDRSSWCFSVITQTRSTEDQAVRSAGHAGADDDCG